MRSTRGIRAAWLAGEVVAGMSLPEASVNLGLRGVPWAWLGSARAKRLARLASCRLVPGVKLRDTPTPVLLLRPSPLRSCRRGVGDWQ